MMVIIVSGLPAVGKSTIAKILAQRFGINYYCGGEVLKEMAFEQGFSSQNKNWWDTTEGIKFMQARMTNSEFDQSVDRRLADIAKKGNAIISSYPLPWLLNEGIKIWLKASQETRAKRMAGRDGISFSDALEIVKKRDVGNRQLYHRLYNINFGVDLSVFDFVIGTDHLSKESVTEVMSAIVKQFK